MQKAYFFNKKGAIFVVLSSTPSIAATALPCVPCRGPVA